MGTKSKKLKRAARRTAIAAPVIGAAVGGLVGAALGAEYGLAGGALGGSAGYLVQKAADRLGETHSLTSATLRTSGVVLADTRHFVGRRSELRTLGRVVEAEDAQVCVLHGFGGCGKSATVRCSLSRLPATEARNGESEYSSGDSTKIRVWRTSLMH